MFKVTQNQTIAPVKLHEWKECWIAKMQKAKNIIKKLKYSMP